MAASDSSPLVLVLAGTTASGKTDVSIPLAQMLEAEIVNADSRQVFRELLIGTAPPSPEQMQAVTHHFVRTRSLAERWTAGDFARVAREVIAERSLRGLQTLVVGGSMLYLRALLDGLYEGEDEPELDYAALRREWNERGGEAMIHELAEVDPEAAARTNPGDHHRALRAIGLYRATGETLSERRLRKTDRLPAPFKLYFLHGDREETYARVNARADLMLEQGLVEEVRKLEAQGFTEQNCNALRTHGYQEVFPYLRGECDYETMRSAIQQAVRHYVKRQLTWFRREPRAVWIERKYSETPTEVATRIYSDYLGKRPIAQK